jgi:predicted flavoprotein YhiN
MQKFLGQPIKSIAMRAGALASRGEIILSAKGIEGGGIYPLSPALRHGERLIIDLMPDWKADKITTALARPRGKNSLSNHIRKTLKLDPAKLAIIREFWGPLPHSPEILAQVIKGLTLPPLAPRPMDEAISTAGGVTWDALDDGLMIRALPGVFAAGEMIDWDAPTGGYLLTACFATGKWAGAHAARYAITGGSQ